MIPSPRTVAAARASHVGALAAVITCLLILSAAALDFPALSGRVVDDANILDQTTRAALTQKLADLETKTTDQLVVVTLKSLQGTSIEDFGVQLGRRWQIGQKDKNNGVLLIVAPSERKVRIEVGYGLEGSLTDAVSRLIIEGSIVPRFRANDFAGGIARGVDDIIQVLSGDAKEWKQRADARPTPKPFLFWMLMVLAAFLVTGIILAFVTREQRREAVMNRLQRRSDLWVPMAGSSSWGSSGGFSSGGGFSG